MTTAPASHVLYYYLLSFTLYIIIRYHLHDISISSTILWSTETWAAASLFSVQPSSRVLPSDPAALVCQRSLMHLLHCDTSRWWVSYNMAQLLVQLGTLLCWWNILQHPDKVFPANLWLEIQLHACLSSFRASCTCLPSFSNAFIPCCGADISAAGNIELFPPSTPGLKL